MENESNSNIESLGFLFDGFRYWIEKKDFETVDYLLSRFDNTSDINDINTALIVTAGIRQNLKNWGNIKQILDYEMSKLQ